MNRNSIALWQILKAHTSITRKSLNKKDIYVTSNWCTKAKEKEEKNNKVHSFFLIIIIQVLNTVSFLLLVGTMTVTQLAFRDTLWRTHSCTVIFLTLAVNNLHFIPFLFMNSGSSCGWKGLYKLLLL